MTPITWKIADLYRQSWKLLVAHKKLLIFGLAVSLFVATSTSSGNSSGSSSSNKSSESITKTLTDQDENIPGNVPIIGGLSENEVKEALSATGYRVSNNLIIPLKTVPLPVYLTLAGEVFVLFLLGLGIHLLASSWSRASLIHAINQADQSNRVSLKQSSLFGFKKFKTILAIDYLPWLPLLKFTIFAILISIIFAILGLAWLIMFPVIAFSVYLIIQYFKIVPAQLFAYRDSIIKDQPFEAAFTAGLSLSKGRLGIMIFTGFVNLIADFVSSLILLLVAGVASFAAIITAFTNPNPQTIAVAVITTLVSLIVAHPAILARTALLNTFKYIVWHFAYMTISPPKGDTSNEIPA